MSDPLSPTVLGSFTQVTVEFNAAAQGRDLESETATQQTQSQSDSRAHEQLTEARKEPVTEMHFRPKDSKLVEEVHKNVEIEAQRRAFMNSPTHSPEDFGPKF